MSDYFTSRKEPHMSATTVLDLTGVPTESESAADGDPVGDHGDPSIDPGVYGLDLTPFDPGDGDGEGDGDGYGGGDNELDAPSEPEDATEPAAPAAPAAASPPLTSAANLVAQLHRRIVRARKVLRSRHSEFLDAKEAAKAAKERFSAAQTDLNVLIGDLCKALSGEGQMRLPLPEEEDGDEPEDEDGDGIDQQPPATDPVEAAPAATAPVPTVDPAKSTPLSALATYGLTESKAEKLAEADVHTVADLLAMIGSGALLKIKGVGKAAVDKIEDAVLAWREKNPAPDEPA